MLDTYGYKYSLSGCVILIAFHCNGSYTDVPQCYVIRTLPALFFVKTDCAEPEFKNEVVRKSVSTNVAGLGTTYYVTSRDDSIRIVIAIRNNCGGTQKKGLLLKHVVNRKIRFEG